MSARPWALPAAGVLVVGLVVYSSWRTTPAKVTPTVEVAPADQVLVVDDETGRPLEGITVRLTHVRSNGRSSTQTERTDAQGTAQLEMREVGDYVLSHDATELRFTVPGPAVVFRLPKSGEDLRARRLGDGHDGGVAKAPLD